MINTPNILFITTDQQRKDTLGCYDNPRIQTPNIDRLAREGVQFDRAYCESPICIPSRITMITGKKAGHHGATLHNCSMRDNERTIGHVLTENGYITHFIGKPHFKSQQHRGTEESIADWRDGKYDRWNGPFAGFQTVDIILGHSNSLLGHYGQWLREYHADEYHYFKVQNMESLDVTCGNGVYKNDIPEEIYSSTYVGDQTCRFLERAKDGDSPFYCFASFPDPHWPVMPPKKYLEMYDDVEMPENTPYNGEAEKSNYPRQFKRAWEYIDKHYQGDILYNGGGHYMKNPDDAAKIMRPYWGAVTLIDKNVGKVLDTLEELGLVENTIVIFTTDHGEYMGAHGMMAKGGFLWEEFVNLPCILRYPPEAQAGLRSRALCSLVDVVPTLLDYAGIHDHNLAPDGISQRQVCNGTVDSLREALTIMHPTEGDSSIAPDQHALISDEWKLVYYAGDPNGELYNLKNDPEERNNLYNRPETREIQRTLIVQLLDEIILQNDKEPQRQFHTADHYGKHVMTYEMWQEEFDQLKKETGKE